MKSKEKVDGQNDHQKKLGKLLKGKHNNKNKSKRQSSRKGKKAFKCH
jgi:hypothetical protein